jgi:hypothetical protein
VNKAMDLYLNPYSVQCAFDINILFILLLPCNACYVQFGMGLNDWGVACDLYKLITALDLNNRGTGSETDCDLFAEVTQKPTLCGLAAN